MLFLTRDFSVPSYPSSLLCYLFARAAAAGLGLSSLFLALRGRTRSRCDHDARRQRLRDALPSRGRLLLRPFRQERHRQWVDQVRVQAVTGGRRLGAASTGGRVVVRMRRAVFGISSDELLVLSWRSAVHWLAGSGQMRTRCIRSRSHRVDEHRFLDGLLLNSEKGNLDTRQTHNISIFSKMNSQC